MVRYTQAYNNKCAVGYCNTPPANQAGFTNAFRGRLWLQTARKCAYKLDLF